MRRIELRRLRTCIRLLCVSSAVLSSVAWTGCSDGAGESGESLVSRGARVYKANCTVCHNPDPRLDGAVGPAIAGSSRALVEARVLHQSYPPGYRPKKDSKLMPALPYLADDLDALSAFLADPEAAREGGAPRTGKLQREPTTATR